MSRNEIELWAEALLDVFKPTRPGVQLIPRRKYWAFIWWNHLMNELYRRQARYVRVS